MALLTHIPPLPYSLSHWQVCTLAQPSSSPTGALQPPLLDLPVSFLVPPSNSLSILKPELVSLSLTHLFKTLLAFLCQLNKTPNMLAGPMVLTLLSLIPYCPLIISQIPSGPIPSTSSAHSRFQTSVLAVLPACCAGSPSTIWPDL